MGSNPSYMPVILFTELREGEVRVNSESNITPIGEHDVMRVKPKSIKLFYP